MLSFNDQLVIVRGRIKLITVAQRRDESIAVSGYPLPCEAKTLFYSAALLLPMRMILDRRTVIKHNAHGKYFKALVFVL